MAEVAEVLRLLVRVGVTMAGAPRRRSLSAGCGRRRGHRSSRRA